MKDFLILLALSYLIGSLFSSLDETVCVSHTTVSKVEACNRDYCSAILADGTRRVMSISHVDEPICTKHNKVKVDWHFWGFR